MKKKKPHPDDRTQASNQGMLQITRGEFARYFSRNPVHYLLLYLSSYLPLFLGRVSLLNGGLRWRNFSDRFYRGDITPVIVLNAKKRLVASYTCLDNTGQSRFHVVKIIKDNLWLIRPKARDGDRYAAIALYMRGPQSATIGRWAGFTPVIVDCVCRDKERCEFIKSKIPESNWKALEMGLQQLNGSYPFGTFDIWLPDSLRRELWQDSRLLSQLNPGR